MKAIMGYIINMLPYMMITVPIYLLVRICFLKKTRIKVNYLRETTLLLFVILIAGLASQTIIPKFEFGVNGFGIVRGGVHTTNLIPFKVAIETYREVMNGNVNYFIINFLGNIFLFIPFGFIMPTLWNVSGKRVIFIGFICSLFIEGCQLFLARGSDVDDLILNTAGVAIGLLLYKITNKLFCGFAKQFRY